GILTTATPAGNPVAVTCDSAQPAASGIGGAGKTGSESVRPYMGGIPSFAMVPTMGPGVRVRSTPREWAAFSRGAAQSHRWLGSSGWPEPSHQLVGFALLLFALAAETLDMHWPLAFLLKQDIGVDGSHEIHTRIAAHHRGQHCSRIIAAEYT